MIDFSTPLQGLQRAESQVAVSAQRLATIGSGGQSPDSVDLSAEAVALLQARNQHAANANLIRTADQLEKATLGLLG